MAHLDLYTPPPPQTHTESRKTSKYVALPHKKPPKSAIHPINKKLWSPKKPSMNRI